MRVVRESDEMPLYVPDYYADSVGQIDFDLLKKQGITCVAFDADSTLVPFSFLPFKEKKIAADFLKVLQDAREKFDRWIIASNRPTNDLQALAKRINAEVVRASIIMRKPRKAYYDRVIEAAGVPANQIAMVGDKLIADVYGAKRKGLWTVWVQRIGRDNPIDSLLQIRRFEKWLIKKYIELKR